MKFSAGFLQQLGTRAAVASSSDWPVYRHDEALSGGWPGIGRITKPEIKWQYYLGAPRIDLATDRLAAPPNTADLDGDGTLETFSLNGNTLQITDFSGRPLWSFKVSGKDGHDVWRLRAGGSPIVADADGDGLVEVLAVGGDGILRVIGNATAL